MGAAGAGDALFWGQPECQAKGADRPFGWSWGPNPYRKVTLFNSSTLALEPGSLSGRRWEKEKVHVNTRIRGMEDETKEILQKLLAENNEGVCLLFQTNDFIFTALGGGYPLTPISQMEL